ncbi:MAG TPA: hypothetical protein VK165_10060 [Azonexus sp.]|nr:hypothetical protein [Azonexus sp.]
MTEKAVSGEFLPASQDQAGRRGVTPSPKIDLRDSHAIRREMGNVYRMARAGKISTKDMNSYIFALDVMRRAYETCVMQDQIEKLEEQHGK